MKLWRKSAIIDFVHIFDVAIATFNNLLKMAVPNKQLNNTDIDKVRQKISALYQCILNVPLWNDWRKVRYSKVHDSPVLKALLLQSFQWISAIRFAELISFWQDPKCIRNRTFRRRNFVFPWTMIWYFVFVYIFPLVLLFISSFKIYNLKLARWFLLTLEH